MSKVKRFIFLELTHLKIKLDVFFYFSSVATLVETIVAHAKSDVRKTWLPYVSLKTLVNLFRRCSAMLK